jgi:apolipoprotein N-acyltransferase
LGEIEDKVKGHRTTLYGETGMAGLVGCVSKTVKRGHLAVTVLGVLSIIALFVVYGMGSYAGEKDKRTKNTEKISVVQQNIKHIKQDQEEIKLEQKEIKADVKEIKKEMIKKKDLDLKFQLLLKAIEKK